MGVTAEQITAIAPRCPPEWAAALARAMGVATINTPERAAMFLAQCAHESAGLTRFEENLNYSANGLMETWPKRFPTTSVALLYARDPQRIANRVYANKLGNGEEGSGDGWRYRGRGCLQLTGRENYQKAGAALRFPLISMPEQAAEPALGSSIAAWYWTTRGLNTLADAGDFTGITRKINGGLIGLDDRQSWLAKARAVLSPVEA